MKFLSRLGLLVYCSQVIAAPLHMDLTNRGSPDLLAIDSQPAVEAPPREFFAVGGFHLDANTFINVGHDVINNTYVILPSPNIVDVDIDLTGLTKTVRVQLYFEAAEQAIAERYNVTPNQIRYLFVSRFAVQDLSRGRIFTVPIAPGASYRPPQFVDLKVGITSQQVSFDFDFVGRGSWSESGVSSEVSAIARDLRDLNVDSNARLVINAQPGAGVEAFEAYTSRENSELERVIQSLSNVIVWGDMSDKDRILDKLLSLQDYQRIHLDLTEGIAQLAKYPELFGSPPSAEWVSVINKLASSKLTEKEWEEETSGNGKIGVTGLFGIEGGGSSRKKERFKQMITFDVEGEFYVPRSMDFVIRSHSSYSILQSLVFQTFRSLKEARYQISLGLFLPDRITERTVTAKIKTARTLAYSCFDIERSGMNVGAILRRFRCHSSLNQFFTLTEVRPDQYKIRAKHSGMCLSRADNSPFRGASSVIRQRECSDADLFAIDDFSHAAIRLVGSDLCMGSLGDREIGLFACDPQSSSQQFQIEPF